MGRDYDGDVNGRFWFGTQSSDAASQFGGEVTDTGYIPYYYGSMEDFDKEHLEELIEDMNKKYLTKVTLETEPNDLYYDEGESTPTWRDIQNDTLVADIQLGLKIYQYILVHGECQFEAEI